MHEIRTRFSRKTKITALILLNAITLQLVFPAVTFALTTGPSQPEVQGFEPVGTTDMVDMFSGSFVYNIPLLDVEGYPINISYHGGVSMEQEASWVGLGWNINPGVINRSVRGLPDDFNGDTVEKQINIRPENTLRVGMQGGAEFAGAGDPALNIDINAGAFVNISNYRGVSCDFSYDGGLNVAHVVSAGVNFGIGSQTGASIDYNASLNVGSSLLLSKKESANMELNAGVGGGGGYSSRSGLRDLNLSFSASAKTKWKENGENHTSRVGSMSSDANIPIGVQNFVPVITNKSSMYSVMGRVKLGAEFFAGYAHGNISAMFSRLSYESGASRKAYGYMYLQNAADNSDDILDFTRDKDGMFNKTMQYLPMPSFTYDIYSVSGQGTGGMFRSFRNDFGNVYDPNTESSSTHYSVEPEFGIGNAFEGGLDKSESNTDITSGPWSRYQRNGTPKGFKKKDNGSLFENVYLKAGGEMTEVDQNYFTLLGGFNAITPEDVLGFPAIKPGSGAQRDARANLVYYRTAEEDTFGGAGSSPVIPNYSDDDFASYGGAPATTINRIGSGPFQRKAHQLSEIVQVQKDGRKYIYGIGALNNVQREASFTIDGSNPTNLAAGTVKFDPSEDASVDNGKGKDHYYSNSITPSYAHSYLLTAVLSKDFTDVTGNGITDDDLGTFTKFNYSRTDSDYRWISPYSADADSATYSPGFWSDKLDDKASFVAGSREQWYLHSIESKNYIAEFYCSKRKDALGIKQPILNTGSSIFTSAKAIASESYKLDSIKLYNKHDRYINGGDATPIKTVYLVYDYSLCPGIPNSTSSSGKLTLKKIYFSYGRSQKSLTSPYQFSYGYNPTYNFAAKDRWGNYKPSNPGFTNYEFPYVNQNDPENDAYSSAWSLNQIILPSGGRITAEYESGDYAYVQDKVANEMFMVGGLGSTPNYSASQQLYSSKSSPNLYVYFKRRPSSEISTLSFAQNYLGRNFKFGGDNSVYMNFNIQLTSANTTFEQIKAYGSAVDIGFCPNNSAYGYVKFAAVSPTGGGASLHPATFTALNTARYNLPQIIFPGQDPDESGLISMIRGLKGAIKELLTLGKNPVVRLVEQSGGKNIRVSKSYMRLQSVGLCKKGGGQRVRSVKYSDEWTTLAGGNEQTAMYGKQYSYTKNDPNYGKISSGVASYEPLIGGDENPFRMPVKYTTQSGSNWPPNDPVDLYQELPLGESLFPPAQVGYSNVEVTSIHRNEGRSSKSLDRHEFYTAKDFPVRVIATSIKAVSTNKYKFFSQENKMEATQGYTLILNDMHGRPKRVEHAVFNEAQGIYKPITAQVYNYKQDAGKLDNHVNCLVYDGDNITVQNKQLGIEEDVTLDTRRKNEYTRKHTTNGNFNFFIIPAIIPIPIGIPFGFGWSSSSENEFQSAVVTKVVQQYGILDNVESYVEGAKTVQRNEIFDPATGQPVVTSITNEYQDKEYTTNIPAAWAYNGMSGAYQNIGYIDAGSISINSDKIGQLLVSNTAPLFPGDELAVSYKTADGHKYHAAMWVMGNLSYGGSGISVLPRFPQATDGWEAGAALSDVRICVISSGRKNMLDETVQSYTSSSLPLSGTTLNMTLNNLISLSAKTFADSNSRIPYSNIVSPFDLNPYCSGERGQWRLLSEYAYQNTRNYSGTTARNAGLFSATSLFTPAPPSFPYNFMQFELSDPKWRATRTITKWSPFGKEVENIDAIGNYSSVVYGYNDELPVAVAANAKQGDVLALNFEEYHLLKATPLAFEYDYMPLGGGSEPTPFSSPLYNMAVRPGFIVPTMGHTGKQCYRSQDKQRFLALPIRNSDYYSASVRKFNSYYSDPSSPYTISSSNEYLAFAITPGKTYVLNYWVRLASALSAAPLYTVSGASVRVNSPSGIATFPMKITSNIIEGWEQVETQFVVPTDATGVVIAFAEECYIDDLRVFPKDANLKAFVYAPINEGYHRTNGKLIATLDENNFATMYEYDQEGNLVRVKKETTKGVMTVSESRSGNAKR